MNKPAVLFWCVHNAGRSLMALGWFNRLAAGRAIAWSGGSDPGRDINPSAISAGKHYDDWLLDDPAGQPSTRVKAARKTAEARRCRAAPGRG